MINKHIKLYNLKNLFINLNKFYSTDNIKSNEVESQPADSTKIIVNKKEPWSKGYDPNDELPSNNPDFHFHTKLKVKYDNFPILKYKDEAELLEKREKFDSIAYDEYYSQWMNSVTSSYRGDYQKHKQHPSDPQDYEPDPLFVEKYLDNPPENVKLLSKLQVPKSAHIEDFRTSFRNKYNFMTEFKHLDKSITNFDPSRSVKRRDNLTKMHMIFETEPNMPGRVDASDYYPYLQATQPHLRPIDQMSYAPALFYELPEEYKAPQEQKFKVYSPHRKVAKYTMFFFFVAGVMTYYASSLKEIEHNLWFDTVESYRMLPKSSQISMSEDDKITQTHVRVKTDPFGKMYDSNQQKRNLRLTIERANGQYMDDQDAKELF